MTELEAGSEDSADGKGYDLFVSTSVGGVDLGAAYQNYDEDPSVSGDVEVWGVSASFDAGFAEFGVDYSKADDGTVETDQYNLMTIVPVAKTTDLGLGMTIMRPPPARSGRACRPATGPGAVRHR